MEGVLDGVRLARAVAKTDPMALRGFLYQATGDVTVAQTATTRTLFGFREIETVVDQDDPDGGAGLAEGDEWGAGLCSGAGEP